MFEIELILGDYMIMYGTPGLYLQHFVIQLPADDAEFEENVLNITHTFIGYCFMFERFACGTHLELLL